MSRTSTQIIDMHKICNKCKQNKPITSFNKSLRWKCGYHGSCKSCWNTIRPKYHRSETPEARKNSCLKKQYKITLIHYNEMFLNQNGKCLICKRHQSEFKMALNVDHCHKTGKIRGLLCHGCNVGLGYFKENKKALLEAVEYLGRF